MSSKLTAPANHFRTIIFQPSESDQPIIVNMYDFLIPHQAISWAKKYNRLRTSEYIVFARVYNDDGEEIYNEFSPDTEYSILI